MITRTQEPRSKNEQARVEVKIANTKSVDGTQPEATKSAPKKTVSPSPLNSIPKRKVVATQAKPQPTIAPIPAAVAEKLNEEMREKLRYDEPDEAIEYYRLKRLPTDEKEIPVEKYLAAKTQMDAMPQYSTAQKRFLPSRNELKVSRTETASEALGTWTSLGPGNVGGRTRALLIHPTSPNVMYAAGVAGGVWKSTNSGALWQPLTDLMTNIAVSCLAFDPNNPNVIYAGTGEGFFNGDAVRGAGIFRTTDGGTTWTQLSATGTSDFYYVNDIVVSKANSQRLYAGTRTGVWRSLDGGATWSRVLTYTDGCLDLVIRTDQATDYLFAACGSFGGAEIFRNTDAGGAGVWTSVHRENGMGRTSLALAPNNQNIIYALSSNNLSGTFRDGLFAVFRSNSSGDAGTWTAQVRNNNPLKLNTILLTNPLASFRSECGLGANSFSNQGWYDNVIAVDPLDANRVWVGGIDLFRSDDGGLNWGIASYWWPEPSVPQYAHADQHAIVFHPNYNGTTNKQMFVGNDGGIFRTDDARATVVAGVTAPCNPAASGVRWTALNNSYGVTQFYHGAVFPDGKSYFGGTQDNGTLLGMDATGTNGWREIWGGDGGYVAIDPTNPQVLYASTPRGRMWKSTDGGQTFANIGLGISESSQFFRFITPLGIDPSNPQRLWTGGQIPWHSSNGGASWQQMFLPMNGSLSAIAIAPTDSNYVLLAGGSYIYRTQTALSSSLWSGSWLTAGFISSLTFDPQDKKIAYATVSTFGQPHLWRTNDAGATWTAMTSNLPDLPVHCLVVDPQDRTRLFIGTDLGVFISTDSGSNFANTPVEALELNTTDGTTNLYAFTHGRGVWRVNVSRSGCSFALSATERRIGNEGGTYSVNVIAAPNSCGWTSSSNVDWIVNVLGDNQTGNGLVQFYVAPNSGSFARVGTLTIAGKSFVVYQNGIDPLNKPIVTITTPVERPARHFGVGFYPSLLPVAGTVTSAYPIKQITWTNERPANATNPENNGEHEIIGSFSDWSIPNLYLQPGFNRLRITATDILGNKGFAELSIIYYPDHFVGTLIGVFNSPGFSGDGTIGTSAQIRVPNQVILDSEGNIYFADKGNHRIRKRDSKTAVMSTIAGSGPDNIGNGAFSGDGGPATQARLNSPSGLTWGPDKALYIVDTGNHRIRRIAPDGTIATVFGGGFNRLHGRNDASPEAYLDSPEGLAFDDKGNAYIADTVNQRIRRVDAITGSITTIFEKGVVSHVTADKKGNVFFTTGGVIRKYSNQTGTITNFPALGDSNQPIPYLVGGLSLDDAGDLYVTYSEWYQGRVLKLDQAGNTTYLTGYGSFPPEDEGSPAGRANFGRLGGLAIDSGGNIVVADQSTSRIRLLYKPDKLAKPIVSILTPVANYVSANPTINVSGTAVNSIEIPHVTWSNGRGGKGVAVGQKTWTINNLPLVSGQNEITVSAWNGYGIAGTATIMITYEPPFALQTVAGNLTAGFNLESGSGRASQLYTPETVALDGAGNLYIADKGNHRIRKVTRSGLISTVAGSGQLGSSGDGGLATQAALNQPNGVAVDNAGNLYISDTNNHRIRKGTAAGIITTIAGTGGSGFSGDDGAATQAQLNTPVGIMLDGSGNLLIADAGNHRIRKLTLSTGIITTIAGSGYGFGGDGGQATQAQLNFPTSVAKDQNGNLYISDTSNHQVRKVTTAGIISRFAGTGFSGFSGDGGQANLAQFSAPGGLAVDAAGNLYVTDQNNNRVRKIAPNGIITTAAGNGNTQSATDEGGTATNAALNAPAGVAVDGVGNLFIADTDNHRVVVVAAYKSAATVNGASFTAQQPVAAEAIVSVFGANLATREQAATQLPLPTEIAGTSVRVRDSLGVERLASLFYVGKLQVNYQIPVGTAEGYATVTITNGNGEIFTSAVNVMGVTPGIFTANQTGSGVAAASVLYVTGTNRRSESTATCDTNGQNCIARQIDLNSATEVHLELYGTGLRNNSGLANVTVTVGGVAVPVQYAGPQCCFIGLDQINLLIPKTLAGRGEVEVRLTIDSSAANPVRINIK